MEFRHNQLIFQPASFGFDISFSFNPGMKITEVASLIGSKWRDLDEEDKKPYEEQALKDKKRYEKEMEAYNQGTFAVRW